MAALPKELKEILDWFEKYKITFNEVRLSECEYITDLRKFIDVQTASARRNWENPTFKSDVKSLFRLKKVLEEKESL